MKAYTLTISKDEFVTELERHQKADNFVRGRYWGDGKGCAVGCSLESISRTKGIKLSFEDHAQYETHLGIPKWLAQVEDTLFEGMSLEKSKTWPVDFAKAIHIGADLEKVKTPFLIMLLEHSLVSVANVKYDKEKSPEVASAINQVEAAVTQMIEAHRTGQGLEAAEYAAEYAAWSAAWSAKSAEFAAKFAARSAAWSAESAAYDYYANRLLEMLDECKPELERTAK